MEGIKIAYDESFLISKGLLSFNSSFSEEQKTVQLNLGKYIICTGPGQYFKLCKGLLHLLSPLILLITAWGGWYYYFMKAEMEHLKCWVIVKATQPEAPIFCLPINISYPGMLPFWSQIPLVEVGEASTTLSPMFGWSLCLVPHTPWIAWLLVVVWVYDLRDLSWRIHEKCSQVSLLKSCGLIMLKVPAEIILKVPFVLNVIPAKLIHWSPKSQFPRMLRAFKG